MGRPNTLPAPPGTSDPEWQALVIANPGLAVVRYMAGHVGKPIETEGPNRGPLLRLLLRGGDGLEWCADIILSLLWRMGGPLPGPPARGRHRYWHNRKVTNLIKAFKRWGQFVGATVQPEPGWLVFFKDHVGMLETFDGVNQKVHTLEGNMNNRFTRRTFFHRDPKILGYGIVAKPMKGPGWPQKA